MYKLRGMMMAEDENLEELHETIRREKKEFKWILRELYETKKLFDHVLAVEDLVDRGKSYLASKEIRKLMSIGKKEGRIERRLEKAYNRMLEDVEQLDPFLKNKFPKLREEINKLIEQAKVYNADLVKIFSRTGEVYKLVKGLEKSYSELGKLKEEIKRSFTDFAAFVKVISDLENKYKIVVEQYESIQRRLEDFDIGVLFHGNIAKSLTIDVSNLNAIVDWIEKEIEGISEAIQGYGTSHAFEDHFRDILNFIGIRAGKKVSEGLIDVNEDFGVEDLTEGNIEFMRKVVITFSYDEINFSAELDKSKMKLALEDFLLS